MKTVVIKEGFQAYPSGKHRVFAAGEEADVPDAFADMVVGKGLAREKAAEAPKPVAKLAEKETAK